MASPALQPSLFSHTTQQNTTDFLDIKKTVGVKKKKTEGKT